MVALPKVQTDDCANEPENYKKNAYGLDHSRHDGVLIQIGLQGVLCLSMGSVQLGKVIHVLGREGSGVTPWE